MIDMLAPKMNLTGKLLSKSLFCFHSLSNDSRLARVIPNSFFRMVRFKSEQISDSTVPAARTLASIQMKKRAIKKKKALTNGGFRITAYSTAEEYNLEKLAHGITDCTSFKLENFNLDCASLIDAIHAVKDSDSELESQHLFFFREGSVVLWNISDLETNKILDLIRNYEENGFSQDVIQDESETMTYSYSPESSKTRIVSNSVVFSSNVNLSLEKYTISNAMAQSVHLGTFEANLQHYIDTMGPVTEDLKSGKEIKMSRDEVLQKTGQLFALRHNLNLNSDLLDTPDFYWDREELENLYQLTANYFCINKRTRVMNEKINHCIELVHLLSSHLNDKHHVRLEWMIIILIMVEVVFEVLHFVGG